VFDKTGTITKGKPRVVRLIQTVQSSVLNLTDIILIAGSAESNSEHPIGAAISSFAKDVSI
jgi:Cu+-exporting ATPase